MPAPLSAGAVLGAPGASARHAKSCTRHASLAIGVGAKSPAAAGPKPRGVATRAYSENVRQALESKKMWEMNEELAAMMEERKRLEHEIMQKMEMQQNAHQQVQGGACPMPPQGNHSASAAVHNVVSYKAPVSFPAAGVAPTPPRHYPAPPPSMSRGPPPPPPMSAPAYHSPLAPPAHASGGPPLAGENVMNLVVVAAECAPWSKTGGLGDVAGALPKGLARRGHRMMSIAPRYQCYEDAFDTGVRISFDVFGNTQEVGFFHSYQDGVDYIFVDHPCFHGLDSIYAGSREELNFRMALLCKAALESLWHVPCGGAVYGDDNTVFIANDWHTALLPVYLQAHYRDYGQMEMTRCIFVIHNITHQGRGPVDDFNCLGVDPEKYSGDFFLDDPVGGEHNNIMKAGIMSAHRVVAVSEGYAWECQTSEGGWGLDQLLVDNAWKFTGVVNGIDLAEWSPMMDKYLVGDGYRNYGPPDFQAGKAQCKAALQQALGLPVRADVPLLVFIGRLDYQKGVDLIMDNADWLLGEHDVQLVMLGSGDPQLEDRFRDLEGRFGDKARCWVGFSVPTSHHMTAAADIQLMPSRFEPCGLNQLYAMQYGTIPVVHAVGGLRDTVEHYDPYNDTGYGWTFPRAESHHLQEALGHALGCYWNHRDAFMRMQYRCMTQDLSWDNAAAAYEKVLVDAKYQW
mmetsp:Transcript_34018/g.108096  ORF Transcript_34018/g.108096 Transcript_34018/m.108096 type:complete len:683 (+) Transcript_34018:78-2126(+)